MTNNDQVPARYVLSGIPNNREGRAFLARLRDYFHHERHDMVVRANGSRKAAAMKDGFKNPRSYDQGLPLRHAETFRVYVNDVAGREMDRKRWCDMYGRIGQLEERLRHANTAYSFAQIECVRLKAERDDWELKYRVTDERRVALERRIERMPWLALVIERIANFWRLS